MFWQKFSNPYFKYCCVHLSSQELSLPFLNWWNCIWMEKSDAHTTDCKDQHSTDLVYAPAFSPWVHLHAQACWSRWIWSDQPSHRSSADCTHSCSARSHRAQLVYCMPETGCTFWGTSLAFHCGKLKCKIIFPSSHICMSEICIGGGVVKV